MKLFVFLESQNGIDRVIATIRATSYQDAMSRTGNIYADYDFRIEEVDDE